MSLDEVVQLLGPGSAGWPKLRTDQFDDAQSIRTNGFDAVVTFNIGWGGSVGIDVYCLDHRVVRAACYD